MRSTARWHVRRMSCSALPTSKTQSTRMVRSSARTGPTKPRAAPLSPPRSLGCCARTARRYSRRYWSASRRLSGGNAASRLRSRASRRLKERPSAGPPSSAAAKSRSFCSERTMARGGLGAGHGSGAGAGPPSAGRRRLAPVWSIAAGTRARGSRFEARGSRLEARGSRFEVSAGGRLAWGGGAWARWVSLGACARDPPPAPCGCARSGGRCGRFLLFRGSRLLALFLGCWRASAPSGARRRGGSLARLESPALPGCTPYTARGRGP